MDDLLTRHDLGPVTRLTLSRPATYNALSLEMIEALIAALARIDDDTRVVILAAEGKAFCAGHDLRQMQAMAPDQLAHLFDRCAHLMQMIPALPQPSSLRFRALPPRRAASWSRPATWRWRQTGRASGSTGSPSVCSAPRRWWP